MRRLHENHKLRARARAPVLEFDLARLDSIISSKRQVALYAKRFGMSPSKFVAMVKQSFPGRFRKRRRLQ
jgi:hypothetical protein